jgi:two-component system, sensor histidine kinase and response regulator
MSSHQHKDSILVVDDAPENLRLLADILAVRGYQVRPARNGPMALSSARSDPPDLILLDILMPDMDGFKVCQLLKADERTRDIPVIFITALSETLDKVKAFSVGGVDYITKPFQIEEVFARVETHLALRRTQKSLQEQIAELDAFAHTVAHDLKGPLGPIVGYAEALEDNYAALSSTEVHKGLQAIARNGRKMGSIISELLLLAGVHRMEVEMTPLDMASIVAEAQQRLAETIKTFQAEISVPNLSAWPVALGYAPWVEEVWVNYLSNAIKFGGTPSAAPRLELGATSQGDGTIRFWVHDNGQGLCPPAQAQLFTAFTRLETRVRGHGLGLSIVKRIVEKLGGQVEVESEGIPGRGSTFSFTLPAA